MGLRWVRESVEYLSLIAAGQPPGRKGREKMSGFHVQPCRGFAAALCAVAIVGVAQAAPTHSLSEPADFPDVSTQIDAHDRSEDGLSASDIVTYSDDGSMADLLPETILGTEVPVPSTSFPGLFLGTNAAGTSQIDAGHIEAIDGWTSLVDAPVGWRTPRDDSGDAQPGFFSAVASADPISTQIISSVSVIPLPAALTSSGITVGLIGIAYLVRRLRSNRPVL